MAIDSKHSWEKPGQVYADTDEIVAAVSRFKDHTLPKPQWNHFTRLTVGHHFVQVYGARDALTRLRRGICAYNEATGVENTEAAGYQETITALLCPDDRTVSHADFSRDPAHRSGPWLAQQFPWFQADHLFILFKANVAVRGRAPELGAAGFTAHITAR